MSANLHFSRDTTKEKQRKYKVIAKKMYVGKSKPDHKNSRISNINKLYTNYEWLVGTIQLFSGIGKVKGR